MRFLHLILSQRFPLFKCFSCVPLDITKTFRKILSCKIIHKLTLNQASCTWLSKFSTKIKLLYIKKMANPLARILRAKPCWCFGVVFMILVCWKINRIDFYAAFFTCIYLFVKMQVENFILLHWTARCLFSFERTIFRSLSRELSLWPKRKGFFRFLKIVCRFRMIKF